MKYISLAKSRLPCSHHECASLAYDVYLSTGPFHTSPEKFEKVVFFFSTVSPTVDNNPARKWNFSKNAFQTRGIWKQRLCVLEGTENSLKTKLFEKCWHHDKHVFTCPCLPAQTQIQNHLWFLCYLTNWRQFFHASVLLLIMNFVITLPK